MFEGGWVRRKCAREGVGVCEGGEISVGEMV